MSQSKDVVPLKIGYDQDLRIFSSFEVAFLAFFLDRKICSQPNHLDFVVRARCNFYLFRR